MEKTILDFGIENELLPNLSTGEKLLWTGKPRTGVVFRSSDIFFIPFSLLWAGFAVFWETSVIFMDGPFFFKLWGIPFLLVSIYITVGRFFVDARKRANTIYGITEDRIIIKSGVFSRELKSLNIKTISEITFSQKANNSGTITLGPPDFRSSMLQGTEWPGAKQTPRLEFIENVKSVYDLIVSLQRQR